MEDRFVRKPDVQQILLNVRIDLPFRIANQLSPTMASNGNMPKTFVEAAALASLSAITSFAFLGCIRDWKRGLLEVTNQPTESSGISR